MNKPDICIYHSPCADGFTAAWVVWNKWGYNVEYIPGVHGTLPPDVTGKHVLIVDFSYKRPVLEKLASKAASVTVWDHHVSAKDDLQPLLDSGKIQGVFDMTKSGALITMEQLFDNPSPFVKKMVQYVSDRDLWQFKLFCSREISANLFSYDYTFKNWANFAFKLIKEQENIIEGGAAIERKHQKDIAELLVQTVTEVTIGGYKVLCANMPYTMASDAANKLAQGKPFGATYMIKGNGDKIFSLRSTDEGEDVSKIASSYGGGGHRNASGFTLKFGQVL